MLKVRPFSFKDIDVLTELMAELGYPSTKEQMYRRMEQMNTSPMYFTFVAELEGNVVGMLGLRQMLSHEYDDIVVQISVLVIKAEYRGKGIGKELIKQAEAWAKDNGAKVIVLSSGIRREEAHKFYKHLGFNATGLRFTKSI